MSETRKIKLAMTVDSEPCDVETTVTDTAVTTALGFTPMDSASRGATNGVASLTSGKVPSSELPSYVDDVVEGYYYNGAFYQEAAHTTLITPETGKIYVDITANESYRYTGSVYVQISQSITVDDTLSDSSTNPLQNKVVKQELDKKVNAVSGKGLSSNDFNDDYKAGLDSGVTNSNFITKMNSQISILENILIGIGGKPKSWAKIQELVRAGSVSNYFSIGDEISVNYNGIPQTWVVAAFDKATPADITKTHSMTLIPQNCIEKIMFDNKEPDNPDSNRTKYGNNRYAHSAIRQWLNSSADAGSWWVSQHEYDAAPDYATTKDGFMKGFDSDFLAVLGKTSIIVAKNTITDGGGSETLSDEYFYLMSKQEVGLGAENSIAEGQQFPIFTDANSRKRTYNGSSTYWWLRSPYSSNSCNARCVNADGSENNSYAYSAYGILPACNII